MSSKEVKQLVYLSDIEKSIGEGIEEAIDLFPLLEERRRLKINDLLELLGDLERHDLIQLILRECPEAWAEAPPHVRQSLALPEQMFGQKRAIMLAKTEEYVMKKEELKVIAHSGKAREGRFRDLLHDLEPLLSLKEEQMELSHLEIQGASLQYLLVDSLRELSRFWKRWPTTISVFQQAESSSNVRDLVDQCHSIFDGFHGRLPLKWSHEMRQRVIDSRDKQEHPIGKVARRTHDILHELSSELLGQNALESNKKMLQRAIFTIESCNYTARYLIPIFKWQTTLIFLAVSHRVDVSCHLREILPMIATEHAEDIGRNWDVITNVVGDEAARSLKDVLLSASQVPLDSEQKCKQQEMDDSTYSSLIRSVCVPWHVTLAVLGCSVLGCKLDYQRLEEKLVKYMVSQRPVMQNIYVNLSKKMASSVEREVQRYRESYGRVISELTQNPQLEDIIKSLFDHKSC